MFVDDQEIGTTPCSAAFVYYGTRKITVMKDGYLWVSEKPGSNGTLPHSINSIPGGGV